MTSRRLLQFGILLGTTTLYGLAAAPVSASMVPDETANNTPNTKASAPVNAVSPVQNINKESAPMRVTITPPTEYDLPKPGASSASGEFSESFDLMSVVLAPFNLLEEIGSNIGYQFSSKGHIGRLFVTDASATTQEDVTASPTPQTTENSNAPANDGASPITAYAKTLYSSPPLIIKKEVLKQDVLQPGIEDLAPSAGEVEASGAEQLIPLPSVTDVLEEPVPATAAEEKKIDIKPEDLKPLLQENPPITPTPASEINTTPVPTAAPVVSAPLITVPEPNMSEAIPQTTSPASISERPVTEPPADLSRASKRIVGTLPADIEKSSAGGNPVTIDRGVDVVEPEAKEESETVKHKAMGISIEVRKPGYNVNYELQRAYDAVLSGDTPGAIERYRHVIDNDRNNKNALFALATLYHRAGQIDLARPLYGKLLAIDPNNRDGLNNFMVLLADEAPEAALEQMEKLEARNPKFSPIPAQMAVIYEKSGNTAKATEKMFRAIELAPENLTYRYNLAIILDKQKKYEEAANLYRQIVLAYQRGELIPGNIEKIQQRLTFISSNK